MVFATFQRELVIIDPISILGAPELVILNISLCCQIISTAFIIRGYFALPSSIIPWISAVYAMGTIAIIISLVLCISTTPVVPVAQWLAYLLYMNVIMSELQLFKIYTIVTPGLKARDDLRPDCLFHKFYSRNVWPLCQYIHCWGRICMASTCRHTYTGSSRPVRQCILSCQ